MLVLEDSGRLSDNIVHFLLCNKLVQYTWPGQTYLIQLHLAIETEYIPKNFCIINLLLGLQLQPKAQVKLPMLKSQKLKQFLLRPQEKIL